MFEFNGKTVIVTGARRGIGKGIALAFAQQGANVVVADVSAADCDAVAQEIAGKGGHAIGVECDVSKRASVESLVQKAVEKFGSLDVMVNNAGVITYGSLTELPEKDIDFVLGVNLKGAMFGTQSAARQMIQQGRGGKVVNTASIAALIGYSQITHYCASKGGIAAFTRAAALELAPNKINVNAIAPGAIDTPMAASVTADPKALEATLAGIPWKRIGKPADIAAAAIYLASAEADYVTGHTLVVDGGWTVQ